LRKKFGKKSKFFYLALLGVEFVLVNCGLSRTQELACKLLRVSTTCKEDLSNKISSDKHKKKCKKKKNFKQDIAMYF